MNFISNPGIEICLAITVLALICGLFIFALLVLRHPGLPRVLQAEMVSHLVCVTLVTLIAFAVSGAIQIFMNNGINLFMAFILTGAVFLSSALVLCKIFRIGTRLEIADSGKSPFSGIPKKISGGLTDIRDSSHSF